ncbi:MAG: WYL domain-containing protein [Gemmatimonadaceae bacterium]|nr:WYL domain-containing protein [Gemmatimonadaceae bacterium]
MPPVAPRDRSERLDLLTRRLADAPGMTAGALAEDLGVSARTLARDLRHLRDRGVPVEASRGRGGGLRLPPRWGLGRVSLAADEGLSILVALAVVDQLGLPIFGQALGRARRRLAAAFPADDRRRLAPLRERIIVGRAASPAVAATYTATSPAVRRPLERGFAECRLLRTTYVRPDGRQSDRVIEPHALLVNWPAWYVVSHDHARGATRTFRVDRFTAIAVLDTRFTPRPRDLLRDAAADVPGLEPV